MFTLVRCPACGGDWADSDVRCPACGFEDAAEDVVASWVSDPVVETAGPTGDEAVCLACGYEGPLIQAPSGDRALCPACGTPWQDAGGILRKVTCPDCGQVILLTEQHRGKTVICPGCHSLMGCLVGPDRQRAGQASDRKSGGRATSIFELMTLISAIALGLAAMLGLWAESDAGLVVQGTSVLLLPICWALTVLRMLAPACVAGGESPPGVAACLAISVGSLLNLLTSWDTMITYVGPRSLFLVAMLRAVAPLPLAAAVSAVWVLLLFDDRWRLEPSWIDRAGRCFGVYWMLAGLALPLLRYFFA